VHVRAEQGRPVFVLQVELPPGQERRLELDLVEPLVPGEPTVLVQPLVREQVTTVSDSMRGAACGAG
jgi:hypothetical protein